eukprot:gene616-3192_t
MAAAAAAPLVPAAPPPLVPGHIAVLRRGSAEARGPVLRGRVDDVRDGRIVIDSGDAADALWAEE